MRDCHVHVQRKRRGCVVAGRSKLAGHALARDGLLTICQALTSHRIEVAGAALHEILTEAADANKRVMLFSSLNRLADLLSVSQDEHLIFLLSRCQLDAVFDI